MTPNCQPVPESTDGHGGYLVEVDSREQQDAIMDEISDRGWDGYNHFGIETVTVGIPISVYQRPRITNLVLWIL